MTALVHVKGLSELNKLLQSLPVKIEQNVLTGALRAGANVIKEEARRLVAVDRGTLRDSIRVRLRRRRGRVTARITAQGDMNEAHWVEFGTAAHFVAIKKEARPARMTRHGRRTWSIKTINKSVRHGSLVIGKNFVGSSVAHPGSRPKPFLRPAMDGRSQEAVVAAGEYIKRRLAAKHGLDTADIEIAES